MKYQIEFTRKAVKDLKAFSQESRKQILQEALILESSPFPFKKKIKKIRGVKFLCYRLRINLREGSCRVFYGIAGETVFVLRIVSKKIADRTISSIRKTDFPPS